jgi:hypothetical protein
MAGAMPQFEMPPAMAPRVDDASRSTSTAGRPMRWECGRLDWIGTVLEPCG